MSNGQLVFFIQEDLVLKDEKDGWREGELVSNLHLQAQGYCDRVGDLHAVWGLGSKGR